MILLQASIGTLNDVVDAARDAGRPDKPIAAGDVTVGSARWLAALTATAGLGLSAVAGPLVLAVGLGILLVGYAYDLRFKGTAWSWLPFAVGIPLLPIHASLGATGGVDARIAVLALAGGLAGAMLAIGNAMADLDIDARSGVTSVARSLGVWRAAAVQLVLLVGIGVAAVAGLAAAAAGAPAAPAGLRTAGLVVLAGAWLTTATAVVGAARGTATVRRWGWGTEAVATAGMAVGWLAATSG